MDFECRKIKKRYSRKIILEFDVISEDIDLVKCQQIANNLAASIPVQLLCDRRIEVKLMDIQITILKLVQYRLWLLPRTN